MRNLIREMRDRNVLRVAAAYLVGAWLIAQVAELVLDSFEAPPVIMQSLLILLGLGLPVALFLAWAFELTPQGIVRESEVDRSLPAPRSPGRKLDFVIIAVLAITVAIFVFDKLRQPDTGGSRSSIAVLPFANRSDAADAAYFVDGVHDDLLTQLARVGGLKVISRTSVMEYRDTTKNTRQIGQELGVATLLEGAVQRAGSRVRVTAQLIDVATDEHLWAESYDRELSPANILDIQTEIARAIAAELSASLAGGESGNALDRTPTQNQQAYDLYLQARAIPFDGPVEHLWRGIELATRAVELDPGFALAMGQVASNYINIYWFTTQSPGHRDAAQGWIDRALAIAPDDPRLHLIRAELLYTGYLDYEAALAALDVAQRGMPGVASVYLNRGAILRRRGDFPAAIEAFNRAQLLDPRDPFSFAHHIFTFMYSGDLAGAKRQSERLLALPTATEVHIGFTHLVDLFMLGDTAPMAGFLERDPPPDLGPEDQLNVYVPFLERRYADALEALANLPDPIAEQTDLWTHSYVRARVLHAQGNIGAARIVALEAVSELDGIAAALADNPRPVAARAMMHAILGDAVRARADAQRAQDLYPPSLDLLDGPCYVADGLRVLAVLIGSDELAVELERYLALPAKSHYVDYLLLDPVFDRHRDHPAIAALQQRYTLRNRAL